MFRNGQTRGFLAAGFLASAIPVMLSVSPAVMAGPQGGAVSAGSGSISQPNAAVTNVIQNTHRMAVDWQSFNLTASETVNFNQPSASAAVLNRIHDQNPSQIFGAINANGRVFLANPNGIVFGQTATVNVGALIAAGMNISNADFMAGNYNFSAGENGAGVVVNRGLINAATGGSVGLLGGTVINEGIIVADYGNIELASGNRAVVNFDGDGLLNIQVSEEVINNAVENDAAVSNRGSLLADGGQVVLTAHAASNVFDNAINNEGIIKAARIDNSGGVIRLVGNSGTVLHSGEISAQGKNGSGGTVHVLGDRVGLIGDASIDMSGDTGGGTVLIGGDYQGKGDIQTASRTYVGSKASINADAVESGDGGQVVVWGDEITRYYGSISSRGGVTAGNGGDVEVSGREHLIFNGHVDLGALRGTGGTLLLDPRDITLGSINDYPLTDPPALTDPLTDQNPPGLNNPDVAFTDFDNLDGTNTTDITINVSDVTGFNELRLQAKRDIFVQANLTMDADNSVALQAQNDINVNAQINTSGSGSISLLAANNINITQDITSSGTGTVVLNSNNDINQTGGVITAATLDTTSNGDTTLTGNNSVGSFTATNINAASGNIDLTTSGALNITAGGVSNSVGDVTLIAGGTITQTGAISTNTLSTSSDGGTTLTGNNTVDSFTASNINSGNVALRTSGALDVALLGISNSVGDVTLDAGGATGGAITQTGTITANTLTTSSNGGTTLSGNNSVSSFTATNISSGNVALRTSGALDVALLGISNSVGDVTLDAGGATGGAITQTGTITTNTLTTSSNGGTLLTGNNSVSSFTATNISSGDVALRTSGALDVALLGISNSVGDVTLDAGGATGGAITQTGTITANTLSTSSNGGTILTGGNTISGFIATNINGGNIALNNDSVGTLNITGAGISQSGVGDVVITESASLSVDSGITASGNTIELIADAITLNDTLTGSAVVLRPLTAATEISLVASRGLGTGLELIQLDINNVSAVTLTLGANSHSGNINLNTDIVFNDSVSSSRLELLTSGAGRVTGSSALSVSSDNTGTLAVSAGSGIDLDGDNNVATVVLNNSVTGEINYNGKASSTTTVPPPTTTTFVDVSASAVNAGGNITLTTNALTTGSITTAGAGTINLTALSGALTLGDNITTSGTVDLNSSDLINQTGGVITSGTLDTSSNGNTTLTGNNSVGSFTATNTNTTSGDIDLTTSGALDIAAGGINNSDGNVTLNAGGAITQTGTITTGTLDTTSIGGTTLTGINSVASFTAGNTNGGGVALTNASGGTLNIATTGIANTGGGNITISESGKLNIDGDLSNADAPVELFANNMDITANGSVDSGSGLVTLSTVDPAREIQVGVANVADTDPFLGITQAMLGKIVTTTGGVTIGSAAHTEGVTVVGNIDLSSTSGTFTLLTQGIAAVNGDIANLDSITIDAANAAVNVGITANNSITIDAASNIVFNPGADLTATNGDISLQANGTISGNGALTIDAGGALDINQALTTNGVTSIKASQMEITKDITVITGGLDIISQNQINIEPDITIAADGRLSIEHPNDVNGTPVVATEGRGNLVLSGSSINLPGDLTVINGNLTLESLGANASVDGLEIKGAVSTTTSGDISITANDLEIDVLSGSISSAGSVTITDNGNNMLLVGSPRDDRLHISISEYDNITATGLVLSSADLNIQGSFSPTTAVPLTIDATNVTIGRPAAQSTLTMTLKGSLDLSDSNVNVVDGTGLVIDVADQFAMNNQLNADRSVSITAATGISMGLPSEINTTNGQVDMIATGGDILLGLVEVGNANVNITANVGSILNNNGVFTDITRSKTNVKSTNVTLDANQNIGLSSTDAITLDINSEGLITLDFGAPKAFINNLQNTRIVNLGSGDVAIGLIFSAEIIGTGHYVGVNNERDPPETDTYAGETKRAPEMISVVGADYKTIPLDEEGEITSTLSPTVPVLIRTTRGWEFKAPSRTRQPGDDGERHKPEKKGTRYIDWL